MDELVHVNMSFHKFADLKSFLDMDTIIHNLEALKKEEEKKPKFNPEPLSDEDYFILSDIPRDTLLPRIIEFYSKYVDFLNGLRDRSVCKIQVPYRGVDSLEYIRDRRCKVLKKSWTYISLVSKRANCLLEAMRLFCKALQDDVPITKRELLYNGVRVFKKSTSAMDRAISDCCLTFECTRQSLNLFASEKGRVIGDIIILKHKDEFVNCLRVSSLIPSLTQDEFWNSNYRPEHYRLLFILIVEHECTFKRLVSQGFHSTYRCIIITGGGVPDLATRRFAKSASEYFKLPVFGLFDNDPHGMRIMAVYAHGSDFLAFENPNLVIRGMRWLGMRPSWCNKNLSNVWRDKMSQVELNTLRNLTEEDFVRDAPDGEWCREIFRLMRKPYKASIFSVNDLHVQFLSDFFIPFLLQEGNFIAI